MKDNRIMVGKLPLEKDKKCMDEILGSEKRYFNGQN